MKRPIINLITLYQKTLSPDHGPLARRYPGGFCRYYPSCSEYAKISVEQYGAATGTAKAVWRVIRCNPWAKPGIDLSCYRDGGHARV